MLEDKWGEVAAAARQNPEVICSRPRKWSGTHEKMARKIHGFLDGDWCLLSLAVSCATNGGAESRLNLNLDRLTSNDCLRLDSLLSGTWEDAKKAKERMASLISEELKSIEKAREAEVKKELERWEG